MRKKIQRLQRIADELVQEFHLDPVIVKPPIPGMEDHGHIDIFHDAPHEITIRINQLRVAKPLKWSTLVDTLIHELAHMIELGHNKHHKRIMKDLRAYCRKRNWV